MALCRARDLVLRIRGHQAEKDACVVCARREPAAVLLCWNLAARDGGEAEAEGEMECRLFSFLTCEANGIVAPIHPKAMPANPTTQDEIDTWLTAPAEVALQLQRPLPDDALRIVARGERKDEPEAELFHA